MRRPTLGSLPRVGSDPFVFNGRTKPSVVVIIGRDHSPVSQDGNSTAPRRQHGWKSP